MRKLSVLYGLLLIYYTKSVKNKTHDGICKEISNLIKSSVITYDEGMKLFKHFEKNRPRHNYLRKFYDFERVIKIGGEPLWWWDQDNYKSRQEFIKHMIKITSR